jgi:hypothetical protein
MAAGASAPRRSAIFECLKPIQASIKAYVFLLEMRVSKNSSSWRSLRQICEISGGCRSISVLDMERARE